MAIGWNPVGFVILPLSKVLKSELCLLLAVWIFELTAKFDVKFLLVNENPVSILFLGDKLDKLDKFPFGFSFDFVFFCFIISSSIL